MKKFFAHFLLCSLAIVDLQSSCCCPNTPAGPTGTSGVGPNGPAGPTGLSGTTVVPEFEFGGPAVFVQGPCFLGTVFGRIDLSTLSGSGRGYTYTISGTQVTFNFPNLTNPVMKLTLEAPGFVVTTPMVVSKAGSQVIVNAPNGTFLDFFAIGILCP